MKTYPVYLGGEFVTTDETIPVRNPATGELLGRMSVVGRDRVGQALEAAHQAFTSWRQVVGKTRGDQLLAIAAEVERRKDELARTITQENGKALSQSAGEVAMTVDHLRWFAEEARRGYGRVVPHQVSGKRHLVIKTPIGPVAAISPWNFPLLLAVRKAAAALAAGCTVVLKPASATPLCAVQFAECVAAAGLPSGAFQLVAGKAAEIADEFLDNRLCRKITFTGSTEVGKQLVAGASRMLKPLSLELGGCAPLLVFADCDLDAAVEATLIAKFRNSGQSCIAANRIYVERPVYERYLERLVARTAELRVGNGLEPGVDIGALINEEAMDSALRQIADAITHGARLLCGGDRVPGLPGAFLRPAVLADVTEASLCFREETFAPIAPVCPFDREDEAIARANDTDYGLSAYAFTRDLNRTFRLMEALESGMIAINDGLPTTSQCPFGGVKQSGWGRELGTEGLDAFVETKHVCLGIGE